MIGIDLQLATSSTMPMKKTVHFSAKNGYLQYGFCLLYHINTCAGVTAGMWAAHLKDCIIELHSTSRNPSETNPYPQEPCQHATAKQKLHQTTTVILRLDFTYYKMMNAPNSTTISNF